MGEAIVEGSEDKDTGVGAKEENEDRVGEWLFGLGTGFEWTGDTSLLFGAPFRLLGDAVEMREAVKDVGDKCEGLLVRLFDIGRLADINACAD